MQLACPACDTAFHVDPAAFSAGGRTVRCACCRNTWFARPEDLAPVPVPAAMTGAGAAGAPGAPQAVLTAGVPWHDTVMVDVGSGPPLAPELPAGAAVPPVLPPATGQAAARETRALGQYRTPAKKSEGRTRLVLVAIILATAAFSAIMQREAVVRALPDLAGFYVAIGLPVNLRGLEFRNLRTAFETQDEVPVLVVEGEIANVTRGNVDVPRLRLVALDAGDRELYAWTAQLERETLGARETMPFRSRLASPPENVRRVMVRFLSRADLAGGR